MIEAAIRVSSSQEFLKEFEKIKGLAVKPPAAIAQAEPSFAALTLEQVNEKIAEFSAALDRPLPDPVSAEIKRRLDALCRQQFILVHGFVPDENGDRPVDEKAIAAKVIEAVSAAAPQSDSCGSLTRDGLASSELQPPDDEEDDEYDEEFDEVLNGMDEDEAAVPTEVPTTVETPSEPLPLPQAVTLSPKNVALLRAALRANLTHVVLHVLSAALQEK